MAVSPSVLRAKVRSRFIVFDNVYISKFRRQRNELSTKGHHVTQTTRGRYANRRVAGNYPLLFNVPVLAAAAKRSRTYRFYMGSQQRSGELSKRIIETGNVFSSGVATSTGDDLSSLTVDAFTPYSVYIHIPFCTRRCHFCCFPVTLLPSVPKVTHDAAGASDAQPDLASSDTILTSSCKPSPLTTATSHASATTVGGRRSSCTSNFHWADMGSSCKNMSTETCPACKKCSSCCDRWREKQGANNMRAEEVSNQIPDSDTTASAMAEVGGVFANNSGCYASDRVAGADARLQFSVHSSSQKIMEEYVAWLSKEISFTFRDYARTLFAQRGFFWLQPMQQSLQNIRAKPQPSRASSSCSSVHSSSILSSSTGIVSASVTTPALYKSCTTCCPPPPSARTESFCSSCASSSSCAPLHSFISSPASTPAFFLSSAPSSPSSSFPSATSSPIGPSLVKDSTNPSNFGLSTASAANNTLLASPTALNSCVLRSSNGYTSADCCSKSAELLPSQNSEKPLFASIYFGGGTPSLLPTPLLQQVLRVLHQEGLMLRRQLAAACVETLQQKEQPRRRQRQRIQEQRHVRHPETPAIRGYQVHRHEQPDTSSRAHNRIFDMGTIHCTKYMSRPAAATPATPGLDPPLCAELTIEVEPSTIQSYEHLKCISDLGFTRFSVGIQSFDDEILKQLGRPNRRSDNLRILLLLQQLQQALASEGKRISISADILYSFQDTLQLLEELRVCDALGVTHISLYEMQIEENTRFSRQPPKLPTPKIAAKTLEEASKLLVESGFEHYEVSSYARRLPRNTLLSREEIDMLFFLTTSGQSDNVLQYVIRSESHSSHHEKLTKEKESKPKANFWKEDLQFPSKERCMHNEAYWQMLPYFAFGSGATSFVNFHRWTRPRKIYAYARWVQERLAVDGFFAATETPKFLYSSNAWKDISKRLLRSTSSKNRAARFRMKQASCFKTQSRFDCKSRSSLTFRRVGGNLPEKTGALPVVAKCSQPMVIEKDEKKIYLGNKSCPDETGKTNLPVTHGISCSKKGSNNTYLQNMSKKTQSCNLGSSSFLSCNPVQIYSRARVVKMRKKNLHLQRHSTATEGSLLPERRDTNDVHQCPYTLCKRLIAEALTLALRTSDGLQVSSVLTLPYARCVRFSSVCQKTAVFGLSLAKKRFMPNNTRLRCWNVELRKNRKLSLVGVAVLDAVFRALGSSLLAKAAEIVIPCEPWSSEASADAATAEACEPNSSCQKVSEANMLLEDARLKNGKDKQQGCGQQSAGAAEADMLSCNYRLQCDTSTSIAKSENEISSKVKLKDTAGMHATVRVEPENSESCLFARKPFCLEQNGSLHVDGTKISTDTIGFCFTNSSLNMCEKSILPPQSERDYNIVLLSRASLLQPEVKAVLVCRSLLTSRHSTSERQAWVVKTAMRLALLLQRKGALQEINGLRLILDKCTITKKGHSRAQRGNMKRLFILRCDLNSCTLRLTAPKGFLVSNAILSDLLCCIDEAWTM